MTKQKLPQCIIDEYEKVCRVSDIRNELQEKLDDLDFQELTQKKYKEIKKELEYELERAEVRVSEAINDLFVEVNNYIVED